jgi:hypothetical protein
VTQWQNLFYEDRYAHAYQKKAILHPSFVNLEFFVISWYTGSETFIMASPGSYFMSGNERKPPMDWVDTEKVAQSWKRGNSIINGILAC